LGRECQNIENSRRMGYRFDKIGLHLKGNMEEYLLSILEVFGLAWWVEIKTQSPQCTYYFGPFLRKQQAETLQSGYIEDLQQEGADVVSVEIKRCKPTVLTDYQEQENDQGSVDQSRSLTGQRS